MSNKTLTLSIVIPVYNEERYLKACLDSIAAQALLPDEVIVVDNNSTDRSAQIAKSYSFVKLLREPQQGVAYARDQGFNAARGDIIGRIDGDSILPKDWTLEALRAFKRAETAAASGPVNYYDMPFPHMNYWINHVMCAYTKRTAPNSPFLFGTNMAIRRKVWLKTKPNVCNQDNIHEDLDLAIHLVQDGHYIHYSRDLLAGASGRRYNAKPTEFLGYINMFARVYRQHHLFNFSMYFSMFMWCLGYGMLHPTRKIWQAVYLSSGTSYPLSTEARKNPMSHV